ncbi:hypothetical protein [Acinetobacter sp. YH12112]|uniref:hypothetical protein n=1 Tax=Acinetobacter sp. YH12112 TaxID=2601099 RepID=UPI0015D1BE28|nr:hypothetical protein [Acinetobacter sp. YH12112]
MSKSISGKEALIALANGEDVQASVNGFDWKDAVEFGLVYFLNGDAYFRLKPRTITINGIEVPAPFEPEEDELYWYITDSERGYSYAKNRHGFRVGIAAWRTGEEIEQVVAALRCVFGGES